MRYVIPENTNSEALEKSMHDELHVISADDFDLCMSWSTRLADDFEFDRALDLIKGAMHKYLRRYPSGKASPRWYYIYKVTNKYMGKPVAEGEKIKLTHDGQTGHYEVEKVHPNGYATVKHDETGQRMSVRQEHLHEMFSEEHKAAIDEAHTRLKHTFEMAKKHGSDVQRENARNALKEHEDRYEIKTPERLASKRAFNLTVLTGKEPSVENHLAAAEANQQAADMGAPQADLHRQAAEQHRIAATTRQALRASAEALKDPDNRFHVPAKDEDKASTPVLVLPKKGPRKASGAFFGSKEQAYSALKGAHEVNENFLDQFHKADSAYRAWKAGRGPKPPAHTGGDLDHLNQALGLVEPKRRLGKPAPDPRVSSPAEAWDRLVSRDKRWDGKNSRKALHTFQEWFNDHGIKLHLPEDAELAINVRAQAELDASYEEETGGEHTAAKLHDHVSDMADANASFDPDEIEDQLDTSFDFGFNAEASEDPREDYQKQGVKAKTFRGWFGDYEKDPSNASKVINAKGEPAEQHNMAPMPVYHGTAVGGFTAFDPAKVSTYNIFGEGFYFTEDKGIAKEYTEKDSDTAKWNSMHGITDANGKEITHLPAKWAEKVIRSTPGYGAVAEEQAYTDRDRSYMAAALKRAMEPQGVNVAKFLQEYRSPSGPILDAKGQPEKYMHHGSPAGLREHFMGRLTKDKVGDYKPAITPPQVFECYLNIRKPIDMDAPISKEDFRDLAGYMHERQKDRYRPQYLGDQKPIPDKWEHKDSIPFYTKNLNDESGIRKLGHDEYSKDFSYEEFIKAKQHLLFAEPKKDGTPSHGIVHLSNPDTLTWGDVHYIMTDGHYYNTEKQGFKDWAQKRGHDGIAHTGGWNVGTHAHKVWIAWAPNQIKAVGNEGTFNATTNDIYKAMNPNIFVIIPAKVRYLDLLEKAGGPYVGPRGGLWADPQHTQHWEPNQPTTLIPKEELDDKVTELTHLSHEDLASIKKQQEEYLAKLDASGEAVPVAAMRLARIIDRAIEKKGPKLVATVPEKAPAPEAFDYEAHEAKMDAAKKEADASYEQYKKERNIRDKAISEKVIEHVKNGGEITLTTHLRSTTYRHPENLRLTANGKLQLAEGRNRWISLLPEQMDRLAKQIGFEPETKPAVPEKPAPTKMVAKVPSKDAQLGLAFSVKPKVEQKLDSLPLHMTEIPVSVKPKEAEPEKKEAIKKHESVGEDFLGSRKHKAKPLGPRKSQYMEFADMSDPELKALAHKDKLMDPLDIDQLHGEGRDLGYIAVRAVVEKMVVAKPAREHRLIQEHYIKGVTFLQKGLERCETADDIQDFFEEWKYLAYGMRKHSEFGSTDELYQLRDKKLKAAGKPLIMPYEEFQKLEEQQHVLRMERDEVSNRSRQNPSEANRQAHIQVNEKLREVEEKARSYREGNSPGLTGMYLTNTAAYVAGIISEPEKKVASVRAFGQVPTAQIETHGDRIILYLRDESLEPGHKDVAITEHNEYFKMAGSMGDALIRTIQHGGSDYGKSSKTWQDVRKVVRDWEYVERLPEDKRAEREKKYGSKYKRWTEEEKLAEIGKLATRKSRASNTFRWRESFTGKPERIGGKPVKHGDEKAIMQEFGFRGVQLGDWVNNEEAEHHLQAAQGALYDLADVMGIDHKRVSFHGSLGLSIGARGSGHGVAKYEPDKKVISLTKFAGGGSLAHEWGHAIDNILAEKALPKGAPTRIAEGPLTYRGVFMSLGDAPEADQDLITAYNRLQSYMQYGDAETYKALQRKDELREKSRKQALDPKEQKELAELHRSQNEKKTSKYYEASLNMSQAPDAYWVKPHEMFARAFSCYVHDKLESENRANTYLVAGTTREEISKAESRTRVGTTPREILVPFPEEKERKDLVGLFDSLMDVIRGKDLLKKALERLFGLGTQPLQRFVIPVDMS